MSGWEVLIEAERLDANALATYAEGRGALFTLAGVALAASPGDPLAAAGRGWALADLARNLADPGEAAVARTMAAPWLDVAGAAHWSRNARALGAMTHLARLDLADSRSPTGAPARVARLLWHRMTGR